MRLTRIALLGFVTALGFMLSVEASAGQAGPRHHRRPPGRNHAHVPTPVPTISTGSTSTGSTTGAVTTTVPLTVTGPETQTTTTGETSTGETTTSDSTTDPTTTGTTSTGETTPSPAAPATCTGFISGQTVASSLDVPAGTTCMINDSIVLGSVSVEGTLVATTTTFSGDIAVDGGHLELALCSGLLCPQTPHLIEGDVSVEHSPAASEENAITGWTIDGSLTFADNADADLLQDDTIEGAVVDNDNSGVSSGGAGDVLIDSTIAGDLDCVADAPPPALSGLVVAGASQGQCAASV
jgi:hypothetical protein